MRRCVGVELGGYSIGAVMTSADKPDSPLDRMSVPPVLVTAPGMGALVGAQAEQFAASGVGAVFVISTGVSAIQYQWWGVTVAPVSGLTSWP